MFEDWLPHNLAIGVSKYDFLHSTPNELRAYLKAYEIKRKAEDERDWMLGMYVHEAFGVVIKNAFSKKGAKKAKYREKPFLKEAEDSRKYATGEGLTEEEKKSATDFLFASLSVMQSNFELSKAQKPALPTIAADASSILEG